MRGKCGRNEGKREENEVKGQRQTEGEGCDCDIGNQEREVELRKERN